MSKNITGLAFANLHVYPLYCGYSEASSLYSFVSSQPSYRTLLLNLHIAENYARGPFKEKKKKKNLGDLPKTNSLATSSFHRYFPLQKRQIKFSKCRQMVWLGLRLLLKNQQHNIIIPPVVRVARGIPQRDGSTLWYCAFHAVISITWPVLICVIKLGRQTILANCFLLLGGL